MPKSHICPSCLTELAWIRAVPDEHYGLPIVVCPSCSMATVRTRHPDIEFWRGIRRTLQSVRNLCIKIVLTALASVMMLALVMASEDLFTLGGTFDPVYPFFSGEQHTALGGGMVLGASILLMGTVVSLYSHRSMVVGVMVFFVSSLFFVTLEYQVIWANHAIGYLGGFDSDMQLPRTREINERMIRLGYLGGVSLAGVLPAYLLRGIIQRSELRRFKRLLNKRRKQKFLND